MLEIVQNTSQFLGRRHRLADHVGVPEDVAPIREGNQPIDHSRQIEKARHYEVSQSLQIMGFAEWNARQNQQGFDKLLRCRLTMIRRRFGYRSGSVQAGEHRANVPIGNQYLVPGY